jgi:hypothetical protein
VPGSFLGKERMQLVSPVDGVVLESAPLESGEWKITALILGYPIYLAQIHPQDLSAENHQRILQKAQEVQQRILAGDQPDVDQTRPLLLFSNCQQPSGYYQAAGA